MAGFDPDAYLASAPAPQAFDPDAYLASQPGAPVTASGLAKQAGVGVAKGGIGLAGTMGDLGSLYSAGASKLGDMLGASPQAVDTVKSGIRNALLSNPLTAGPTAAASFGPNSSDIQGAVEKVTGPFRQAQNVPEQYAQTLGEFLPGAIGGVEGLGARLLKQVALPAIASETAGQATAGTAAEPYARIAAALAAPIAGGAAATAARRVVTPLPVNPARQAAVQTLTNEGVPVTAGQASGSNALRYMESSLGDAPFAGNQATRAAEQQGEAFTRATLRRVGEDAPRATPDVVDRAFTRIGGEFDRLAANNTLQADRRMNAGLQTTELEYNRMTPPNAQAPVVREMIQDIRDVAARNGGTIPGDQYQAFRSRLDRAGRATRTDPQLSGALFDIRNTLDDAMERSIRPQDQGAWREVRRQYRNMLVVEKAASGAGENAAQGLISPAALRNATVAQGRRAYARGQGDFADLAHAGETLLKPMPQSGTAPRAFAAAIPAIVGAGLAGGPGAAIGAAGSVVAPGMAGRALMSRPVQGYLGNQLLPPRQLPPDQLAALRRMLLANAASLPLRTPSQVVSQH